MSKIFRCMVICLGLVLVSCAPVVSPTPIPPSVLPPTMTATVAVTPTASVVPTVSADAPFLPNPVWQPGALNSAVTQDTIQQTICVPGYSSSIRPPVSYTDALKVKQIAQYGYVDTNTADYEEDHLIALSSGGNPTSEQNLWPQPRNTQPYNASLKDVLEYKFYKMICSGQILLADAQHMEATDWVAAYQKFIGALVAPPTLLPPEP